MVSSSGYFPKDVCVMVTRLQKVVFQKGGAFQIGWIRADVLRKVDVSVVKRELGKSF